MPTNTLPQNHVCVVSMSCKEEEKMLGLPTILALQLYKSTHVRHVLNITSKNALDWLVFSFRPQNLFYSRLQNSPSIFNFFAKIKIEHGHLFIKYSIFEFIILKQT